jgi:hypothetical protein
MNAKKQKMISDRLTIVSMVVEMTSLWVLNSWVMAFSLLLTGISRALITSVIVGLAVRIAINIFIGLECID